MFLLNASKTKLFGYCVLISSTKIGVLLHSPFWLWPVIVSPIFLITPLNCISFILKLLLLLMLRFLQVGIIEFHFHQNKQPPAVLFLKTLFLLLFPRLTFRLFFLSVLKLDHRILRSHI